MLINKLLYKPVASILIGAILFVVLFFCQLPGINLFIWNVFLIFAIIINHNKEYGASLEIYPKKVFWIIGSLLVSGSAAYYGDLFSILFSITLFIMAPLFLIEKQTNFFLFPLLFVSNLLRLIPLPYASDSSLENYTAPGTRSPQKILYLIIFPLFLLFGFSYLYYNINETFAAHINRFQFEFLQNGLFWWLLGWGVLWMFFITQYKPGLFKSISQSSFFQTKFNSNNSQKHHKQKPGLEVQSGWISFFILNLLLLVLLFFDFHQLLQDKILPDGKSYSTYIHEGVTAVIISIIFAIGLVLFYLGKSKNQHSKNLYILSTSWVLLNGILILTTGLKNQQYIDAYGLTEKRLGVYAFLGLAMGGLIFTFIKIIYKKTNYYLINSCMWMIFSFLIFICPINWSTFITRYNLHRLNEKNKFEILSYVYTLPIYNTETLIRYEYKNGLTREKLIKDLLIASKSENTNIMLESYDENRTKLIYNILEIKQERQRHSKWPSQVLYYRFFKLP